MNVASTFAARLQAMQPPRFAVLVFVAALLPRLAFVLAAGRADLSLDEIEYHLLAMNLSEGEGYRWFFDLKSSFRPPGYPFLLAALYYFTGPDYFLARIVQTLPAATIGLLTWGLGRRCFPEFIARLAGMIAGLYPPLIFFSVALMSENVFIPLLLLCLSLVFRLSSNQSPSPPTLGGKTTFLLPVVLGFSAAIAILMRPELTYLLPMVLLWLIVNSPQRRAAIQQSVVVVVIVAACVAPWCVRNFQLTGRFVYLDTRTGYNLYQGYNARATGTFDLDLAQEPVNAFIETVLKSMNLPQQLNLSQVQALLHRELLAYQDPSQLDYPLRAQFDPDAAPSDLLMHDWAMGQVGDYIREHPGRALALIPLKCAYFWDLEHRIFLFAYANNFIGPLPRPVLAVFLFLLLSPFVVLVVGSIAELFLVPSLSRGHVLLLLPMAFYTLLHSLTFGEARFHYVLIPILAILAVQGWARVLLRAPRAAGGIRRVLAVAMVLVFLAIWCHGIYTSRERWSAVFASNGNTSYIPF